MGFVGCNKRVPIQWVEDLVRLCHKVAPDLELMVFHHVWKEDGGTKFEK